MNQQTFDQTTKPQFESQAFLGETLRRAREARGVDLREISEHTNISKRYLQAIENSDYSSLPGGIFNRGFVKAYARYVGMDEEEAMRSYSATLQALGQEVDLDPLAARPLRHIVSSQVQEGRTSLSNVFWSIMVLAVIVLCALAIIHYYRRPSNEMVSGDLRIDTNSKPAPVTEAKPASGSLSDKGTGPSRVGFNVQIKAVDQEVWLQLKSDDEETINVLLKPEEYKDLSPTDLLVVKYSKSRIQYLEMKINGKPARVSSGEGNEVVMMRISPDNIAQYMQ